MPHPHEVNGFRRWFAAVMATVVAAAALQMFVFAFSYGLLTGRVNANDAILKEVKVDISEIEATCCP